MPRIQRLLSIYFVFALLCAVCLPARAAAEVPDPDRTGNIRVTMQYNGQPVAGGTLSVYRVGQIREEDANYRFALTDDFAASGVSLDREQIREADLARTLADFADREDLTPEQTGTIQENGTVSLDGLALGLYLVKQNQAAPGYLCADPFLVTVPYLDENGVYQYEIDASPKVSALEVAPPSPAPSGEPSESQPSATATPMPLVVETGAAVTAQPDATLPQTGQLNWPIPVLVVLGLALFALGWLLRFGKKDRNAR